MPDLEFKVNGWVSSDLLDPAERETLASFTITAGERLAPVTEVNDLLAHTVREYIHVPAYLVARWLVVHWWRLRWEPRPEVPTWGWLQSHSLSAISSDYAWPSVTFASDGHFIHLLGRAEPISDVAAVRYLRSVDVRIPVHAFEKAIDAFLDVVEMRLASRVPAERELAELRAELREERCDAALSRQCRLQALAGFDPGAADAAWLHAAQELATEAGPVAGDEVIAASPRLSGQLDGARRAIDAMRTSRCFVQLPPRFDMSLPQGAEFPWQRGQRLAAALRRKLGWTSGPIGTRDLESVLDIKLPVPATYRERVLIGAYTDHAVGSTSVLVASPRLANQRFFFSRLIAAALVMGPADRVLPVSDVGTSLQKLERAFAQELLCPWAELDAFTTEKGTDEEGVLEAAEYFGVSEYVILTALVNNGKVSRSRLPLVA